MNKSFCRVSLSLIVTIPMFLFSETVFSQDYYHHESPLWKSQQDEVYLQEVSEKIKTESPVSSLAVHQEKCYAIVRETLHVLEGRLLVKAKTAPEKIEKLYTVAGSLWAQASTGLYRLNGSKWEKADDRYFVDFTMHQGKLYAATVEEIYEFENDHFVSLKPDDGYHNTDLTNLMEDGSQLHLHPVRLGPIQQIASYSGTFYVLRPGEVVPFDGKTVDDEHLDWGRMPSQNTKDMLSMGSRLYISTDRSLVELRGTALNTLEGKDGLPYHNTTCLEQGFDGDLWIGTTKGAIRKTGDEWQYLGADQWLPGDHVNDIEVAGRNVYIATDSGIGIIRYEPYTLLKKAEYYERHLEEWGQKRLGFIHTLYNRNGEWIREISDNDGGHTAPYLAAMCYKYAVTGDKKAREEAVESFKAMVWMEKITPRDGLIARAIWSATGDEDEMSTGGSGGLPAKWYPTEDGKWYWKGDTSSDEVIAHFYAVSVFYELVAEGPEKEAARQHLARVTSYIQDNGWMLIDHDGKPTRWGRWDPKYLLGPYGYTDRGVNGLEVQTFTRTAFALTGDKKYEEGFQQLVGYGYLNTTVRQKNTFPPGIVAPWDDNLAFRSYYTLLRYTQDPKLRSLYLRSLERTWEIKRMEHLPWYNFTYGAITGNDCDQEESIKHLRAWTLDCIEYKYENSHRDDLLPEKGYGQYEGAARAVSPRESVVKRGSRSMIQYDNPNGGWRVIEPTGYLCDYWMGRYHGLIEAPTVTDPELISVKSRKGVRPGAEPYKGPGRPSVY